MKIKTSKQALATYLGWDISEVEAYRYHFGRTTIPVYAIGENYYCAARIGKAPAKYRFDNSFEFTFTPIDNDYIKSLGWIVYIQKPTA